MRGYMPNALDVAFVLLFAVVIAAVEAVYFNKRFKARVAAGVPNARRDAYRRAIIGQWALALIAVVLWVRERRPWGLLWLSVPSAPRLWVALGLVVLSVAFGLQQVIAVRRVNAAQLERLRVRVGVLEFLMPHTREEYRWFVLLSFTAGVCEELLYRGYLTWVAAAYVGLPIGIATAVIAFGLAHAYQGIAGILKTGAVGLVMSLIVVAGGSLLPAMLMHFLVDYAAGELGRKVFGEPRPPRPDSMNAAA
jgi:membrane protease YdiL (CAAX protease family)